MDVAEVFCLLCGGWFRRRLGRTQLAQNRRKTYGCRDRVVWGEGGGALLQFRVGRYCMYVHLAVTVVAC